jgi:hypothetical protein
MVRGNRVVNFERSSKRFSNRERKKRSNETKRSNESVRYNSSRTVRTAPVEVEDTTEEAVTGMDGQIRPSEAEEVVGGTGEKVRLPEAETVDTTEVTSRTSLRPKSTVD